METPCKLSFATLLSGRDQIGAPSPELLAPLIIMLTASQRLHEKQMKLRREFFFLNHKVLHSYEGLLYHSFLCMNRSTLGQEKFHFKSYSFFILHVTVKRGPRDFGI